jgi:hypothetical protein
MKYPASRITHAASTVLAVRIVLASVLGMDAPNEEHKGETQESGLHCEGIRLANCQTIQTGLLNGLFESNDVLARYLTTSAYSSPETANPSHISFHVFLHVIFK